MTIPKKLKIGGHTYRIHIVTPPALTTADAPEGIQSSEQGVIEINAERIQTHREQTLFHEIFHVLNSELDHVLLESLSQQLYQVLHDNRMLR
jgi:hypothetical protein